MVGIGYPDNFGQRSAIEPPNINLMSGDGVYTDASLIITNSKMNSKFEVIFKDAYPINLSDLQFDSTVTDIDYITCSATFAYRIFTISQL